MNRAKIIIPLLLVGAVGAGAATHGFGLFKAADAGLKLYGNVDVRQVDLAFRIGGRISAMAVEEGAKVSAGTELSRLDARTINDAINTSNAQIAQAEADLSKRQNGNRPQEIAAARAAVGVPQAAFQRAGANEDRIRANLARAEAEYRRRLSLVGPGAVSQQMVEQARAEVAGLRAEIRAAKADMETASAQLRQAQAALSLQQAGARSEDIQAAKATRGVAVANRSRAITDLNDTVLRAPESGTVLTRAREPGAIVQPGEAIYTLTIDHPMRVRAYIAQRDLARISPGMAVTVTADGNAKTYHGVIGFISPTAEFTPKSVQTEDLRADLVYRLRINVSDPDDALRQGQPVSIAVPSARAPKD